jgi:hypothetical protein
MARQHGSGASSGRGPLCDLIGRQMAVQSLSLHNLAKLVHEAGSATGTYSRATPQLISKWRSGKVTPGPHHIRLLASALNQPLEEVAAAAEAQRSRGRMGLPAPALTALNQPASEVRGADYVEMLRQSTQSLVALDSLLGGDDAAELGLRLFGGARRRVTEAGQGRTDRREMLSAVAELAEVAGWLLFDANRQNGAAELNQQALLLAQLSGDRALEVLILQNMSLQAHWRGQAVESLALANRLLELANGSGSARLRALLGAREARALALIGRGTEAERAFESARFAFFEGPSRADPSWTWWLDEAEFSYHEGQMRAELREWPAAEVHLRHAVAACPQNRPRDRTLYRAYLLDTLIRMKAEPEATRVIDELVQDAEEIRSSRTAAVLSRAVDAIHPERDGRALRDAGHELRGRLTLAGYSG